MKTPEQIQAKIKEIEKVIEKCFCLEMNDEVADVIREHLKVRTALRWVISEYGEDEYHKKIEWELMCFESTKIF